jgi:hypothetical protein
MSKFEMTDEEFRRGNRGSADRVIRGWPPEGRAKWGSGRRGERIDRTWDMVLPTDDSSLAGPHNKARYKGQN